MDPDPDDILRDINEESENDTAAEITRLKRKRKGFRAAFTEILNIIDTEVRTTVWHCKGLLKN